MNRNWVDSLQNLEETIQYAFKDRNLLYTALTHTSFSKGDNRGTQHNERLEFLGDAVLELCTSDFLFRRFSELDEGHLTRIRSAAVCEKALYIAAKKIQLSDYLRLGNGEEHSNGRNKQSILSDAFEALIGAIYLDGGFNSAKLFIDFTIIEAIQENASESILSSKDHKTELQEYVQKKHLGKISYVLVGEEGPDHDKVFKIEARLDDQVLGTGIGKTKQSAGQSAAESGLLFLQNRNS